MGALLSLGAQHLRRPATSGRAEVHAMVDEFLDSVEGDLAGQQVVMLVQGRRQAGTYAINWDGRDESGRALATGMYFYRLKAGEKVETRKLMLLR